MPPTDEELQRFRRTREVLEEAGWVFDEFINNETRYWLTSNPDDVKGREAAYMRARVATELKVELMREVEQFENDRKIAERREQQMTGGRNGRADRPN
jgi:SH3-like domain-containing protein